VAGGVDGAPMAGAGLTWAALMKIRLDNVSASDSESGDYFQVLFEAKEHDDSGYVLIQRQFEDPDGGLCYVETHDENYIGHCKVARASLARSRFWLELRRARAAELEVMFEATDQEYGDVERIMRLMIPGLEVFEVQDAC
jgi:hypothetical protein